MYGNGNGINAYRQTNVITADPGRLVLMCYEGAIGSLKTAKEKYISREYEAKAEALQKAQTIICELMQALDFEKGGEVAGNLERLYNYMLRRITVGDLKGEVNAFDEVILMLEELESAWKEISHAPEKPGFIHDAGRGKPAASRAAGAY
ncbi:MAG: flagellar export chaperone FliS [Syntrophobacterales bacterium]|nr:flagellar export chaperone FliS [Syntrophobacterales bacterium]